MALTTTRISVAQIIYHTNELTPLFGAESTDSGYEFKPWAWDDRIWTTEQLENSDLAIPTLTDASRGALTSSFWQSGVGDIKLDCEVIKPVVLRQESLDRWTVAVRHGYYFVGNQRRYLFADRSTIQYVDNTENEDDVNVLTLTDIPRAGSPISATIWERDSYGSPLLKKYINKHVHFTGWYEEGTGEAVTYDGSTILWDNVDITKNEFIVVWPDDNSEPTLWFNKDYTFLVGKDTITEDDDLYACDFVGVISGTEGQAFLMKYFPILDNDEFTVYLDTYSTVADEGTYTVDFNRGEITFITPPAVGTEIYIRYRVTVEVEYESEDCNDSLLASYINLNPMSSIIDRGFIYLTEQELRVTRLELRADAAIIDEDTYGPLELGSDYCFIIATAYNMYGQTVPGVEVSFYLDNLTSGYLNGYPATETSMVSVMTDGNGEARILYTVPRSIESVGQYVAHSSVTNRLTLLSTDGLSTEDLSSIFVFYVFDDDPVSLPWIDETQPDGQIGKGGRKVVLYKQVLRGVQWEPGQLYYAGNVSAGIPTSYVYRSGYGFYKCLVDHTSHATNNQPGTTAAGAYWEYIGSSIYGWGGGIEYTGDKFWSDSAYNPVTEMLGAYIPLRPTSLDGNDLVFEDELGSDILLSGTQIPNNRSYDAWNPGQTYTVDTYIIGSDNRRFKCLVEHYSTNANQPPHSTYWQRAEKPGNLVAYWVTGGKYLQVHAETESYFYNTTIQSNDVSLQLTIPDYMKGVYINEQLQEVPYGFRLYDTAGSMSSALNSITFLGINF